jgi:hypothetical protein
MGDAFYRAVQAEAEILAEREGAPEGGVERH